jgi:hypothetical protein
MLEECVCALYDTTLDATSALSNRREGEHFDENASDN